jgi:putative hydrolase
MGVLRSRTTSSPRARRPPSNTVPKSVRKLRPTLSTNEITNSVIAEWLALEADHAQGMAVKALRRASRRAFLWPVEVTELVKANQPLTELAGVGPFIERTIKQWLDNPPPIEPPPPIRQNFLSLTIARSVLLRAGFGLPRGDLQMHSKWSDGSAAIGQMAEAGRDLGYEYIAITDHSKGLKIAGGINEIQLEQQAREIEEVNSALRASGFQVLRSIEMNLSPDGSGDMDPEALERLDLVVGSFHSRLRVTEDQTERYLAALRNPCVHILGHPRGRIYNYRMGLSANWPKVFAVAAKLDKAIEVDSYPDRQDIDVELLQLALDSGVKLAVDTDAHHPEQLSFVELGCAAAALVGFPQDRIINFMPVDKLLRWARSR